VTLALTQPIKWHGGKHYLADWIISLMPPHTHYVEPFFGGGSVLLKKDPNKVSEVANDAYGELTNFWCVLRDENDFKEFQRNVQAVPFSEIEFYLTKGTAETSHVEAAVQFFIQARQSRQGLMRDFATLSRNRTRRGMNEQVSSWLTAIDGLPDIHSRLKRVVILGSPAVDVIRKQDGVNTHFYCDPPYLHETRMSIGVYEHEMTVEDHVDLIQTLACIEGTFQLSGYPSELYDGYADKYGWKCESREIDNKASGKKVKETKIECLWMNY
jgi:DNA adenine methylase